MTLVDTPGMLWPEMEQDTAFKLAATHSIGRAAYDDQDVALALGRKLFRATSRCWGIVSACCQPTATRTACWSDRRGATLVAKRGGRTSRGLGALLNDFRSGALGRITLETVDEAATAA